MEGPDTAHQFVNGDRVELLTTTDPYTRLSPGDQGTVRHFFEHPASADGQSHGWRQLCVAWDNGSRLALLLDEGDQVRRL